MKWENEITTRRVGWNGEDGGGGGVGGGGRGAIYSICDDDIVL